MTKSDSYILGLGIAVSDYLILVDKYPALNEKTEALETAHQGGGPVATAMAAASVLGSNTRLISVIGDDEDGRFVCDRLESHGVDTSALIIDPNAQTPRANIWVEKRSGLRSVILDSTGSRLPEPHEIPEDILSHADLIVIDGRGIETTRHAVHLAKKHHIPIMLDAGSLRPGILEVLEEIDILICSENFAVDYTRSQNPAEALRKLHHDQRIVTVITLGERGCMALFDNTLVSEKAIASNIVDTTGAGDVFHGAFATAFNDINFNSLHRLPNCLKFSSIAAGLSCRALGGRGSLPNSDEVLSFMGYRAG